MPSKGNLFICCTPLQGLIAEKIIKQEGLNKELCHIFFYTSFDNEVYRNYYDRVRSVCATGEYYVWRPNFPTYLREAKDYFASIEYDTCWLASIDSPFAHFALGVGGKVIYTFDDGTANIVCGSRYYEKPAFFNHKRLIFWLMGNRYNMTRVRSESVCHYTVFPGLRNIIENTKSVDIVEEHHSVFGDQVCTVVLGTVLRELCFDEQSVEKINNAVSNYVATLNHETFYIPHPREGDVRVNGVQIIKSNDIAEDVITKLLSKYSKVYLVGFGSTAQLNMALLQGVENLFFSWQSEPKTIQQIREMEEMITARAAKLVDLDGYA